jgi:polyribonucleotide nucleotidyltransferase
MLETLPAVKPDLSVYAPKIIKFNIDPEKIREVIGSGGKVINKIIEDTGVKIDITDDGLVFIASSDAAACELAKKIVLSIAKDPEIGDAFEGKVVRILTFGAFVELAPGKDGMIHISKLANYRVEKVEDVINLGDVVKVKVINIDEKSRIDLKLLEVIQKK